MPNRLAGETSPYLLQHKDNPVDWYPWGPDAMAAAALLDKPILLSVGYSACHWCHVMERESFENSQIAAMMNQLFVNIKVDREERPDVDSVYMAAVQAMTGHGGWPMTVFLTPDGRPFYGGTYFPPEDRGGLPSFPRVLQSVAHAFTTRRGDILGNSSRVIGAIQAQSAPRRSAEPLEHDLLSHGFLGMIHDADRINGGFGLQPKFPQPMVHEFLLRYWQQTKSADGLGIVKTTLEKMARGGIFDQVGGGFHRYSTDSVWLAPHFEKMLYDNALLAVLYLHGWQATGEPLFRQVVDKTLNYVLKEMTHPSGGFYSAQDADSEGEEGKFFVWLPREINQVLGPDLGRVAMEYWGVTREGNWEGKNILNVGRPDDEVAATLNLSLDELHDKLREAADRLYEARSERVHPGLDDKVLTAWNGMMMKAFAECGSHLNRPDWVAAAEANAEFLLSNMVVDGRLLRTWRDGSAKISGYLEDYAFLVDGLISLYEATFDRRWLDEARFFGDRIPELFWDDNDEALYDAGSDHDQLIVRPRDLFDNAMPCGNSAAVMALLRLGLHTGEPKYQMIATSALSSVADLMQRVPNGFAWWLCALDFKLARVQEVVVMGAPDDPDTALLLDTARNGFSPNRIYAGGAVPSDDAQFPLLAGKTLIGGKATAYLCENYACLAPTTDPAEFARQLA